MTPELQALLWVTIMLFVLLSVQGALVPLNQGFGWGLGSRDEPRPMTPFQDRMKRVVANHIEGMVLFASLVVIVHLAGRSNAMTEAGAMVFVAARLGFALSYMAGLPVIRSLLWGGSVAGLGMIGSALL